MKKRIYTFLILSLALVAGVSSCETDGTIGNDKATLVVNLTDAPADYEEVLIDVQDLMIHVAFNDSVENWISLPVNKGIYNLLDLRNGMDTLLATAELPSGNISQMRLVLGENNSLKVNGEYYDLETPSAQQSGLKFNINKQLEDGMFYEMWIDFDAARSIVARGNGTYGLKPVIRIFTEVSTGAIKGRVLPLEAKPFVMAIAGDDTLSAMPFEDGRFMFKGVASGFYRIEIVPVEGFSGKVIEDAEVKVGSVTDLGTINLE